LSPDNVTLRGLSSSGKSYLWFPPERQGYPGKFISQKDLGFITMMGDLGSQQNKRPVRSKAGTF